MICGGGRPDPLRAWMTNAQGRDQGAPISNPAVVGPQALAAICAPARHRQTRLNPARIPPIITRMFTIEHDFDATVITLIDEGEAPLAEDVIVEAYEDCVILEQLDAESDTALRITLSIRQINDLAAALNLPEGIYRLK